MVLDEPVGCRLWCLAEAEECRLDDSVVKSVVLREQWRFWLCSPGGRFEKRLSLKVEFLNRRKRKRPARDVQAF